MRIHVERVNKAKVRYIAIICLLIFADISYADFNCWDFGDGNYDSACGSAALQPNNVPDSFIAQNTKFGTTKDFGIPPIGLEIAHVMAVPDCSSQGSDNGYWLTPGFKANGSADAKYLNRYTVIFDILYPQSKDKTWRALLNTNTDVANSAEFYVLDDNTFGPWGSNTNHADIFCIPNTWYRIAIVVDMQKSKNNILTYVNGVLAGSYTDSSGIDESNYCGYTTNDGDEWPYDYLCFLGSSEDSECGAAYINALFIADYAMSSEDIAMLSDPSADGISVDESGLIIPGIVGIIAMLGLHFKKYRKQNELVLSNA
jgi:hypothetical protein